MYQLIERLNSRGFYEYDDKALIKAAKLAKADLTTELVKEFTELQGIVGGLYARAQGLDDKVASAIYWQYSPSSPAHRIPPTVEGQLLGLADRIHTIEAMFRIGNAPTGSKDPFALRRAANAVVKILAESRLPLMLADVITAALPPNLPPVGELPEFLRDRLGFYLKDVRGYTYDVVSAVLAAGSDDVPDAIARAEALTAVRGSADFIAISAAFKRIKNILRQASDKGEIVSAAAPTESELTQVEECKLLAESALLTAKVAELRQTRNYAAALEAIATLRPTIDSFFDAVMVMAPEPHLRAARLALIKSVLHAFSGIADFSEIVVA